MNVVSINKNTREKQMAPIVVVGGFGSGAETLALYTPLLHGGDNAGVPFYKRYIHMPHHGLASREELFGEIDEKFIKVSEMIGKKVVVAGHSLGGHAAQLLARDHPDRIAGVSLHASAHDGIKTETFSVKAIKKAVSRFIESNDINHDSDYMIAHRRNIASSWDEGTPMQIISTPLDDLVVFPHGLNVELPEGQVSDLNSFWSPDFLRKGVPDHTKILPFIPPTHILLPAHIGSIMETRRLRQEVSEENLIYRDLEEMAGRLAIAA